MITAVINIEFDDNSMDPGDDRARCERHAKEIARNLTDHEPRVAQAEFVGFLKEQHFRDIEDDDDHIFTDSEGNDR